MANAHNVQIKDIPKEWFNVSRWRGLLDVFLVWAAILATAWLVSHHWYPALYLAGLVLTGGLINHFTSLIHHSVHRNLHPRRAVNDWVSRMFCCAPIGQFLSLIRKEHLSHHMRFGAHDDPERFYYDLHRHGRYSVPGFIGWMFGLFAGWVLIGVVKRNLKGERDSSEMNKEDRKTGALSERDKLVDVLLFFFAQAALFGIFWMITGVFWGYFAYWVLPVATFGAGFSALRATMEHASATEPEELLLSFKSNPIERFFVSQFQFNYHYEHHRFIAVPYYHTPKIRGKLIESNDYDEVILVPSYAARVREVVGQLKAQAGKPAQNAP